jgi:hypothetical protein
MATLTAPTARSAGVFHRFNGKSLVWYPKAAFDAAGYTVPTTWDELLALTQQIADDGDPAWCIGIESGAATGWPATDWTEETMLRTTSLENYDAWVEGTLPFDSPEVRTAIEAWSEIWFNPDFVFGGTDGIVSTNFGDSPAPMFEDPPGNAGCTSRATSSPASSPKGQKRAWITTSSTCRPSMSRLRSSLPRGRRHHGHVQRPARSARVDGVLHDVPSRPAAGWRRAARWRPTRRPRRRCTALTWSAASPSWWRRRPASASTALT